MIHRKLPQLAFLATAASAAVLAGSAGVTVVDGSLEQMFEGGLGGPIAIRLDGPVLVDCDGTLQHWTGNLIAPGRVLPSSSGGQLTVTLSQGQTTLASTGARPAYIVS
ncbi:hypothetical protein JK358_21180 [Nocardia sp. 2]|uniref:Uncharacterized protein n=1 Tax=Nocardia acididurans TaxID=2802282 RepID=A0ABS1M8D3_9NOCA|nr:hypothetical protein [Nocardia acididurans]MBL1076912.1 hypothetical protein [Nocardia acididurans]